MRCETCNGRGEVPEQHDYDTEWLGCQDCQGTGIVDDGQPELEDEQKWERR